LDIYILSMARSVKTATQQLYSILIVDKKGNIKTNSIRSTDQLSTIYKKCTTTRTAKAEDYPKLATWALESEKSYIDIYGKIDGGRAGSENKYELPPPLDTTLLFNSFVLVKYSLDNKDVRLKSLTVDVWKKHYTELMGGFEDLDSNESSEEDELEDIPDEMKTKNGYLKDGFIVDEPVVVEDIDDSDDGDDSDDSDDDDSDDENTEGDDGVSDIENDTSDVELDHHDIGYKKKKHKVVSKTQPLVDDIDTDELLNFETEIKEPIRETDELDYEDYIDDCD